MSIMRNGQQVHPAELGPTALGAEAGDEWHTRDDAAEQMMYEEGAYYVALDGDALDVWERGTQSAPVSEGAKSVVSAIASLIRDALRNGAAPGDSVWLSDRAIVAEVAR